MCADASLQQGGPEYAQPRQLTPSHSPPHVAGCSVHSAAEVIGYGPAEKGSAVPFMRAGHNRNTHPVLLSRLCDW